MARENKFILVSMDDERSKKISDVLGSKTSKKIIDVLAETSGLSEKDISDKLVLPINTVEYNLKKLVASGIVEKAKNFFWSKKGKKIVMYKLSNKSIIISPKSGNLSSKIKSLLPAVLVSLVGTAIVKTFFSGEIMVRDTSEQALTFSVQKASDMVTTEVAGSTLLAFQPNAWLWFLAGSLIAIFFFAALNWRKL